MTSLYTDHANDSSIHPTLNFGRSPNNWKSVDVSTAIGLSSSLEWSDSLKLFVTPYSWSNDGITWAAATPDRSGIGASPKLVWDSVRSRFLSVGTAATSNVVSYSSDGKSWDDVSVSFRGNAIAYSPIHDRAIVASYDNKIYRSDDGGLTWIEVVEQSGQLWGSIIWVNSLSKFIAVCSQSNGPSRTMTSADGLTWDLNTTDAGSLAVDALNVIWVEKLSLLVAVGNTTISTSPDGDVWTNKTVSTGVMSTLTYNLDTNVIIASTRSGVIYSSFDAVTWETSNIGLKDMSSNAFYTISYSPHLKRYVAMGYTGGTGTVPIYYSDAYNSTPDLNVSNAFSVSGTIFVPPRMTTDLRNALPTLIEGMMIYNTTTQVSETYNGTGWI